MVDQDSELTFVFGMLAVQLDFVSSEHLAAAMQAWHLDPSTPVGEVLHQQGVLSDDERQLLDALSVKYLQIHGGNARKSLAAMSANDLVSKAYKESRDPNGDVPVKTPTKAPGVLQRDLERWLADFPSATAPVPFGVKAWRFVNLNRTAAAATFGAGLFLILALALTIYLVSNVNGSLKKTTEELKSSLATETEAHRQFENDARLAHISEQKLRDGIADINRQKKESDEKWNRAERIIYAGQIAAAQAAWQDNNAQVAFEKLGATREDLRGWEHQYLMNLFNKGQLTFGKGTTTSSVAFSRDGRRVLSGGLDGNVVIWDTSSGRAIGTMKGHAGPVRGVAFISGQKAASCGDDKTVRIWDLQKNQELRTLSGHTEKVNCVAASLDGTRLVSAGDDKTLKMWDAKNGEKLLNLNGHTGAIFAVAINDEGTQVASAGADGTVKVWDLESGLPIFSMAGHKGDIYSVAFSGSANESVPRIVSGGADGTARIWDIETGKEVQTLKGHKEAVAGVAINADASKVLTGGNDALLKVWDVQSGKEIRTLKGHSGGVRCVAMSGDGRRFTTASADQSIKIWDANADLEPPTLKGHADGVTAVAVSHDGRRIVSGSRDGELKFWGTSSLQKPLAFVGHKNAIWSIAMNADGRKIVSGGGKNGLPGELFVWNAQTGKPICALHGHTDTISSVSMSPDGNRVVSGSHDSTAKLWDAMKGDDLFTVTQMSKTIPPFALKLEGNRAGTIEEDRLIVWDMQEGRQLAQFTPNPLKMQRQAPTLDGRCFWTGLDLGNFGFSIGITDLETGQSITGISTSLPMLTNVLLSPDRKRLATCHLHRSICLWDVQTGELVIELRGHDGLVSSIAFSGDGRFLVSGGDDKTVRIWDGSPAR